MKNKLFFMVDLETLSTEPNAAILSIGATTFGKFITFPDDVSEENSCQDRFYMKINPASYSIEGSAFHTSEATREFWSQQSKEIREEAFSGTSTLGTVVLEFSQWIKIICNSHDAVPFIFGNGAPFDNVVLRHALQHKGIYNLWPFRNDMCYRTICTMFPDHYKAATVVNINRTKHSAIADAIHQANVLEHILKALQAEGIRLWL